MDYLLAIDQGTHASRALLFDACGRRLAGQVVAIGLTRPAADRAEQDPGEILASVRDSVSRVIAELPPRERGNIRACGISTQRSTVLAWSAGGAPLSPAIGWQDLRGAPLVEALRAQARAIREQTGLPLSPHYGASKLHWLHQLLAGEPSLRLGPLAAFLLNQLTGGGHRVDHANAQRMQLLNLSTLNWSPQIADWFSLPLDTLPACRPVIDDHGILGDHDIPVTAVCGDQNAAWHSEGRQHGRCARINLGTGAFILAAQRPGEDIPELLSTLSVSDAHGADWLIEGTVNGAGAALQWLIDTCQIEDLFEHLPRWLEQVQQPPLFLNTVGGLGSPWWRQGPPPAFVPEDTSSTPAERAVAVVESILFLLQCNLERILGKTPVECLKLSGGLSRLDGLCQKLANLSGLEVERCDDPEASARGAAWLAAGCPDEWPGTGGSPAFQPLPDAPLRARFRAFLEHLQESCEVYES